MHLWVAISPHGFGHAAMTSPVVAELRRRHPDLRLTLQTALPRDFLDSRFGAFELVPEIPDFGLCMTSAVGVDLDASAAGYRALHADWPAAVECEAERLAAARPDLVLGNVPYVVIAGAAAAGIPVAGYSSLEWSGIYQAYLGDRPEATETVVQMRAAYNAADVFIQVTPAMPMPHFPKLRRVGPVARAGRKHDLGGGRVGLIAFGGIDHALDLGGWPRLAGWRWLTTLAPPAGRDDIAFWEGAGLGFSDLLASVDVVVTKPGYGTFTEAAIAGIPVLFTPRPEWPECPHIDDWLARHTRALAAPIETIAGDLENQLRTLFSQPARPLAVPSGIAETADILDRLVRGGRR